MEGNEIQPCSLFLRTEIRTVPTVVQGKAEKLLRMAALKSTGYRRDWQP